MEVILFYSKLWLMVMTAHVHTSYSEMSHSLFHITPSRLQLFEYKSVYFTCERFNISAGWKVRSTQQILSKCSNSTVMKSCGIKYAFASDSGEYWCESGAERSNAVSITVSAGAVILESPVHPVGEGDAVTLQCRNKITSSNFTADFYKDNFFMGTRYEGKLEITDVSKSHEGLYKCKIHGVGESPESWVAIRRKSNAQEVSHEEIAFSHNFYIFRCTAVMVGLALQLLVLGLLQWKLQLVLSVLLLLTAHFQ